MCADYSDCKCGFIHPRSWKLKWPDYQLPEHDWNDEPDGYGWIKCKRCGTVNDGWPVDCNLFVIAQVLNE